MSPPRPTYDLQHFCGPSWQVKMMCVFADWRSLKSHMQKFTSTGPSSRESSLGPGAFRKLFKTRIQNYSLDVYILEYYKELEIRNQTILPNPDSVLS